MTQSAFDPKCLGQYPAANPPKFLHFEFEGESSIHRYMLVDKFHVNDINPATKRCQGEGDDESIRMKYVHPIEHIGDITPEQEHPPAEPEKPELPTADEETENGPATEVAGAIDPTAVEPSTEPEPNAKATVEQPEAPAN